MANKTSQRMIDAQERQSRAVQLRRMGWSFGRIADTLGMSKSATHKAVTKALTEARKLLDKEADLLRVQELERLDELQSYFWIEASKGNMKAADRILKIVERRCRLLGLDAPAKIAATNPDGTEAAQAVFVAIPPTMGPEEWVQAFNPSKP